MRKHLWSGLKMGLVLASIVFVIWAVKLDCQNQAHGGFQSSVVGLSDQAVKGDHVDSTSEDFVFNDAFRITSAADDSMFMTKKYIDDAASGLIDQSVKGDHVDSTSEDFVFNDAYRITSAQAESIFITKNHVEKAISGTLWVHLDDTSAILWGAINDSTWYALDAAGDTLWAHLDESTAVLWTAIHDTAWMVKDAIGDTLWAHLDESTAVLWTAIHDTMWANLDESTTVLWVAVHDTAWMLRDAIHDTIDAHWATFTAGGGDADKSDIHDTLWAHLDESTAVLWVAVKDTAWMLRGVVSDSIWQHLDDSTAVLWTAITDTSWMLHDAIHDSLHANSPGFLTQVQSDEDIRAGTATDEYYLTYEATGDSFEWVSLPGGGDANKSDISDSLHAERPWLDIADDGWIGLGSGSGKIEFDNQTIDEINFLNCYVGIGTSTPKRQFDFDGGNVRTQRYTDSDLNTNLGDATFGAGNLTAEGTYNNAFGRQALYSLTSGIGNVAIGSDALYDNTTGGRNIGIGYCPLQNNTEGSHNIALGYKALNVNTTGNNNISIGSYSTYTTTSGSDNIVIGYDIDAPDATASDKLNIGNVIYGDLSTSKIGIGIVAPPEAFSVVGNTATGDTAEGDVDVYHYFSTDGSWTTEYLKWDDGNSRFELSDDLYVGGTILSLDTLTKSFVIASPDDTFDFPFWQTKRAITIVAVSAVCTGGTNVIGALQEYNATGTAVDAAVDADWTITTSEYTDDSFTNAGIDAGDWLGWKTTSVSGSVTFFSITFEYTEQ